MKSKNYQKGVKWFTRVLAFSLYNRAFCICKHLPIGKESEFDVSIIHTGGFCMCMSQYFLNNGSLITYLVGYNLRLVLPKHSKGKGSIYGLDDFTAYKSTDIGVYLRLND